MAYFKINNVDVSSYVSALRIDNSSNFIKQTNAKGNSVVDLINDKYKIEVEIIPLEDKVMKTLHSLFTAFECDITFRNAIGTDTTIHCILPKNSIEYYTIQANRVLFNKFKLTFEQM